jgi:transcriptional regulator with XRE-family HTH domain
MGQGLTPQEALGEAICRLRDERGLEQHDVAERANLNTSQLSRLEHGRIKPSWGTVRRVAAALGLPMSELVARAEQIERNE